jgi:hypothetical protein
MNKIKVGSIVKALAGPHKGQDHEVIAIKGNSYNITPVDRKNIKYKLGAASASEKQIELVKESEEQESENLNEYLTSDEKKLIDKMYDKKGKLTPLGKKVMNYGKKPGDKGYIEEAVEIYKNKDLSIKKWTMGFDTKGDRISGFAIYGGKIGKISAKDNLVQLTKPQMQQLIKDLKSLKLEESAEDDISESTEIYDNAGISVTRFSLGKGKGVGYQLNAPTMGSRRFTQNYVHLTKEQIILLSKEMKKIISSINKAAKDLDENTINEGLRHIKTANFRMGSKLMNDIMTIFKPNSRLSKELNDAADGKLNKKYNEIYKHLRMAAEIFDDLEVDVKMIESVDLTELDLSVDKFVAVAKGTKTKNKFFVFNNKGQVYHTAPTLDKAKKLAGEYKKNPEEMGSATILDLTKGKIIESVEIEENAEVDRITKLALSMKVGDKTNFGVIKKMGKDWISVKAKDTPLTKLKFNQRKSGGRYVLSLLSLMEDTKNNETTSDISRAFTSQKDSLAEAAAKILNKE